jgi:multidrug efflux pump subunit AcrB
MAVLFVYFVLSAQYESWLLPIAVILVVPLGLLGVVAGVNIRHFDNNVYTQIGMVLIIGLATKNAILIVEFAVDAQKRGESIRDAALEGARLRLRPILMTSLAFIAGVLPLALANGAGAASQNDIGTGVIGGMLSGTALAIFFVPLFYELVRKNLTDRKPKEDWPSPKQPPAPPLTEEPVLPAS